MNECVICRGNVFLPVEMTCFPCYRKNNVCCSSFCRVCRQCAHDYLQLDKSLYHRDIERRCLYCPSVCSTISLTPETSYRKDFIMICADTSVGHRCPYCNKCSGTQLAVDQHIDSECEKVAAVCACGVATLREGLEGHYPSCRQRKKCMVCDSFILLSEFENHMNHRHQHMRCGLCSTFILFDHMTVHLLNECRYRTVRCDYCHTNVVYHRFAFHMHEHENYFQDIFTRLMQAMTTTLRDYHHFRRIRNRVP